MKKLFLTVLIISLTVLPAAAGELNVGVGQFNGHSNVSDRCTDKGVAMEVGYTDSIYKINLLKYLGVDLRLGGIITYANFQTAYRAKAELPRSDRRRENLFNLSGVVKPTVNFGPVFVYGTAGIGAEYFQPDGYGVGHLYGFGAGYKLTDSVLLGVDTKKFFRRDTGNHKQLLGQFTITF